MNTIQQQGDEMVEMFKNFFRGYGISFDYDGWQLYKNEVNKQSTRIAIAHCKLVIEVLEGSTPGTYTNYLFKKHRLILSELEGRVK